MTHPIDNHALDLIEETLRVAKSNAKILKDPSRLGEPGHRKR